MFFHSHLDRCVSQTDEPIVVRVEKESLPETKFSSILKILMHCLTGDALVAKQPDVCWHFRLSICLRKKCKTFFICERRPITGDKTTRFLSRFKFLEFLWGKNMHFFGNISHINLRHNWFHDKTAYCWGSRMRDEQTTNTNWR